MCRLFQSQVFQFDGRDRRRAMDFECMLIDEINTRFWIKLAHVYSLELVLEL
jgi:hypothetical protein